MSTWLIILSVIGLVVVGIAIAAIVVLMSFVELKIILQKSGSYERIWVGFRMCHGLINWRKEVRTVDFQGLDQEWKLGLDRHQLRMILNLITGLLEKTEIKHFIWDTELGLGEAPHTAIGSGVIWSIMSYATGTLTHILKFTVMPSLDVIPRYNELAFSTRVVCISRIRVVHSIGAAYLLITRLMRAKGVSNPWRIIQSKA
ncbi:DUF2953 domain-containing protein [Paenibacillus marinisediminis]